MANATASTTVTLTSSDPGEITVPATVVIQNGQQSANFTIAIVDDGAKDGTQTAFVTATAVGTQTARRAVAVRDDD